MDGVNVTIGSDKSTVEGSTIQFGDIAGDSIEKHNHHIVDTVQRLENRVAEIEKLLGGNLGTPGLTHLLMGVRDDVAAIKLEMNRYYVHPAQYVYLLIGTGSLILAVLITVWGLWK